MTDVHVDPVERVRLAGRRLAEPMESLAQTVARRAMELVLEAVDVNALLDGTDLNKILDQIDVNRLLERVDVDKLITKVDVMALLDQVDVNEVADRVDVAALVDKTEIGAIVSRSSSTLFSEGIDLVRSQAVGMDDFFARWVNRLLRRNRAAHPAPAGPPRLANLPAEP